MSEFKKFIVTNTKTGESFHVQSRTAEDALLTCSSKDYAYGGIWKYEDCEVEEEKDESLG